MQPDVFDILIVGAGPSGLACAIEAQKSGFSYLALEKGAITESIRRFPTNMIFFSTPELLSLDGIPFNSTNVRPTRREALQYYRGVVEYQKLNLRLHTPVERVTPENGVFTVETSRGERLKARRVIVATGYFDFTNRLNIPGEDLPHVSHYYDEPYRYAMSDVVVVGGRNSATEAALELWRHGARVTLVHRQAELGKAVKYWVRPDIDNRIKNGEITAHFSTALTEIRTGEVALRNTETGKEWSVRADFVFPLIGYRPDEALLRGAGVSLNAALIPHYSPETFETNVEGLYIAGSVACGCETWSIFIENGREHAKPIIAHIRQTLAR